MILHILWQDIKYVVPTNPLEWTHIYGNVECLNNTWKPILDKGYKRASQRANMYAKLFPFLSVLVLTGAVPFIEYTSSNESLGNVTSGHPSIPLKYYGGKSYYFEVNLKVNIHY
ncbi:hypothetical protein JTB14_024685 [Gonioctena quinquepunctata]|nr:hypothetical protein JTB14_024685 [Gonioctena quinquepunctata]